MAKKGADSLRRNGDPLNKVKKKCPAARMVPRPVEFDKFVSCVCVNCVLKVLQIPLNFHGPGPLKNDGTRIKSDKIRSIKLAEPSFETMVQTD